MISFVPLIRAQTSASATALAVTGVDELLDWTCPMDPDVHLGGPGKCPRCGMTLVLKVPDRVEYPMELTVEPKRLRPGDEATLCLRILDAAGAPVSRFELVHEKLIHVFVVSESLRFFAHVHPVLQADGSFLLRIRLPEPGMYRLLGDFYPSNAVPQLAIETLYVQGASAPAHLVPSVAPQRTENLTASLRLDPEQLVAGLLARLIYDLEPVEGLELYLGAWGHMLVASEDLVEMIHSHPFLVEGSKIQFNIIFPRAGKYKIWTQFQRRAIVNTTVFTVAVTEL